MDTESSIEIYKKMLQPQIIPSCLYEHMLKMVAPFTIRGFCGIRENAMMISRGQMFYIKT